VKRHIGYQDRWTVQEERRRLEEGETCWGAYFLGWDVFGIND
jgi:hypothetical protein